jgi:hypothetical protein
MTTVPPRFHGLTARERFCRIGGTDRWRRAPEGATDLSVETRPPHERLIEAQGQSPRRPQADRLQLVRLDRRRFGTALQHQLGGQEPSEDPATGQHRRGAGHPGASSSESRCAAHRAARVIERRGQTPTSRGPFGASAV